MKSVFVMQT